MKRRGLGAWPDRDWAFSPIAWEVPRDVEEAIVCWLDCRAAVAHVPPWMPVPAEMYEDVARSLRWVTHALEGRWGLHPAGGRLVGMVSSSNGLRLRNLPASLPMAARPADGAVIWEAKGDATAERAD